MNPITPVFDPSKLTGVQLDGAACVKCHAETDPMKPVGHVNGGQVFACSSHGLATIPSWLVEPCPGWCTSRHEEFEWDSDRTHWSDCLDTQLRTMKYEQCGSPDEPDYQPHVACVAAIQGYREAEARLTISDDLDGKWAMHLTLDEAEQHAHHLLDLVRQARGQSWKPIVTPFDHEGRCDDMTCKACFPIVEAGEIA